MLQKLTLQVVFPAVLLLTVAVVAPAQQTITGTLQHDGTERNYRLYIPSGYSSAEPTALVFNLHGYTSNATQQEIYSGMNDVAEAGNFLVCYPNGISNAWNVGWAFGSTANDVDFISTLIDLLADSYAIDPARVYSCGMSNGGFMSYRLACELNDRIAAVASVTGSMAPQYFPNCEPGKPVPVMEIHGTADIVVPYGGSAFVAVGIEEVVNFWVEKNGCDSPGDTTFFDNTSTTDLSTASRIDWAECDEDSKVAFIKIQGGGHTWPGSPIPGTGATNQDFSASEAIWAFFNQFAPEPSAVEEWALQRSALFPNPASEVLHLRLENGAAFEQFEIFDSISRRVAVGKWNGQSIDISSLQPGFYVLALDGERVGERLVFVKK